MNFGKWLGIVALALSLYILWRVQQLILLLFAAVLLANALNVLVRQFVRWGVQRGMAVFLAAIAVLVFLLGAVLIIVPPFIEQFQEVIELIPQGIDRLNESLDRLDEFLASDVPRIPNLEELFDRLQPLFDRLVNSSLNLLGGGLSFLGGGFSVLLNLLLVVVLALMLLADPQPYREGFVRLFPSFYRRRVWQVLDLCEEALRGWLVGIAFNMAIISVLSFAGLLILRVKLALAQALLAGLLTFVPNIGPALSVIPPFAIGLLDAPWKGIAVLILYTIIQQVEGNILTPLVMAQQVSLLPAITLLAQLFFATFFGFLGLLLALPLTVIGQVWIKEMLVKDILDRWRDRAAADDDFSLSEPEAPSVFPEPKIYSMRTVPPDELHQGK